MVTIFPEIRKSAQKGDGEFLAAVLSRYLNSKAFFLPHLDMAKLLGSWGANLYLQELSYSGALLVEDLKGGIELSFFINQNLSAANRSFTAANLLGHFFFDVQPQLLEGSFKKRGIRKTNPPLQQYENWAQKTSDISSQEARDNKFAAALLMPKLAFLNCVKNLKQPQMVAQHFKVTTPAVMSRYKQLTSPATNPMPTSPDSPIANSLQKLRQVANKLDSSVPIASKNP